MDMLTLLGQLSLGMASNAIYDLLMSYGQKEVPAHELTSQIQNQINLHGITMQAETVINALAQNGFISIRKSHLHADNSLIFGSVIGSASVGNNSKLTTNNTAIEAKGNASMNTKSNAQIKQNPDGSISFHVGDDGNINFKT